MKKPICIGTHMLALEGGFIPAVFEMRDSQKIALMGDDRFGCGRQG